MRHIFGIESRGYFLGVLVDLSVWKKWAAGISLESTKVTFDPLLFIKVNSPANTATDNATSWTAAARPDRQLLWVKSISCEINLGNQDNFSFRKWLLFLSVQLLFIPLWKQSFKLWWGSTLPKTINSAIRCCCYALVQVCNNGYTSHYIKLKIANPTNNVRK